MARRRAAMNLRRRGVDDAQMQARYRRKRSMGMPMLKRREVLIAPLGLLFASRARAQSRSAVSISDTAPDLEISRLVRHRILEQHVALAAVLATLRGTDRSVVAVQDPRSAGEAPGLDTIFEIASLTKIFTALLLAEEVVRGHAKLTDPLQAYVPGGVVVPEFQGHAITLADLATHGASLPLRPNLGVAPDTPNKYAGYTLAQLFDDLPDYQLARAPGSRFEYSNVGFALLGQGLALRSGEPFADLLKRRITDPLGLIDTGFVDDPDRAGRRAQGHDFYLNPISATGFGALDPAGGLRSTAHDLLILLELFLNQTGPRDLVEASRLMLSIDRPGDDAATHMALGWRRTIAHGEIYYWSIGSGDGSRTFMGFNPARRVAVVALADTASGQGLDDIGRRVLDSEQNVDTVVRPVPITIALAEEVLGRAIGTYQYAPDDVMEISRGATGLIVTAGTSQLVIQPQSDTRYVSRMAPGLAFEFEDAETGPASALILHQDGQIYRYERIR
jgi:CubicO group peptidase (beta-lactamase class C family)